MWRAFFYAIGTMLIVLGIQCVLVGQFNFSTEASIPKLAKRFLGGLEKTAGDDSSLASSVSSEAAGFGGRSGQSSAYGPSRFSDRNVGNDRFFAANSTNQNSGRMAFANFSNSSGGTNPPSLENPKSRGFKTQDWMPWSLIAAGAIVLIYTHSFEHRSVE